MDNLQIQWFPGHMTKAHRLIKEHLKLVDVVVELLDARIPHSSANPIIQEVTEGKPRVVVLNKADLSATAWNEEWIKYYRQQGLDAIALEATSGKGVKQLIGKVENAASVKIKSMLAKGIRPRAVRAMILGIPNVGKSSLINRLLGSAVARTGDTPGLTRGKQWIKIGKNLELLDTPGVLWPKFDDPEVGFKLAITGAINDDIFDIEKVALKLLSVLQEQYPERLRSRYGLQELPEEVEDTLRLIGAKRGCLRGGGIVDIEKTGRILFNEFRTGKLGAFTLDYPPSTDLQ